MTRRPGRPRKGETRPRLATVPWRLNVTLIERVRQEAAWRYMPAGELVEEALLAMLAASPERP